MSLTLREKEAIRDQSVKALRARLQERQPRLDQYQVNQGKAAHFISGTLIWSKAAVPIIALLAALASSVRTVQTASEIYSESGSHPLGVILAAIAFTVATEGALFALALAQEGEAMKARAEKRPRHVISLKTVWNWLLIRLGQAQPPRWDQTPHSTGIGPVLWIAFAFAVAANAYMGLKPLIADNQQSLQEFVAGLANAEASNQLKFLVDLAGVLFPPFMALQAGHLTARFAAEISEQGRAGLVAYEKDLESWRGAYANPLETEEGQELYRELLAQKETVKAAREASKAREAVPFGSSVPTQAGPDVGPMIVSVNGSGGAKTAAN